MNISLDPADHRAESSSDVILAMQHRLMSLAELSLSICLLRKKKLAGLQLKFYPSKKMGTDVTQVYSALWSMLQHYP